MSRDCLNQLIENVNRAPTDAHHEEIVRQLLELVARECPMPALVHLGRSLIDYRKGELKAYAALN